MDVPADAVVEDVAADLPGTPLIGVEGAQDVLGVLEVVVVHLGPGPGPGVDAGLPQVDVPYERLRDPEAIANWPQTLSRDGARTPMPWSAG